ncbi:MAG: flagellar basal body-associated FliL family protein [Alphaproteobacteria bacterium]
MAAKPKKEKKKKPKKGEAPEAVAEGEAPPAGEGGAEGEAGAEGEGKKKKLSGKSLILFIVLPAILVLGGGGGAAYFLLFNGHPAAEQHADAGKGKGKDGHGEAAGTATPGPNGTTITQGEGVIFVTLPEMLVNITGADGRPAFLKLKLTLEAPDDQTVQALTPAIPRVNDEFNGFLREMRTDDLSGSAGAYRLRLELLRRVNLVIAPSQVNAVLIEEMLVQ